MNKDQITEKLSKLLADSFVLKLKTQNYHWNVTGPLFPQLHTMFQTQYEELEAAIDEIAERIRALGMKAPGSMKEFGELSTIEELTKVRDYKTMLQDLVRGHEEALKASQDVLKASQQGGDEITADLAIGRSQVHDKTLWMLRTSLEG